MIKATKTGASKAEVTWDSTTDDPRGWLATSFERGHIQDALAALADPMQFANIAADDHQARGQLTSVAWLIDQLTRRQDALIVALKDRGASWTDLVLLVDPEESDPQSKRSAMQRRYEAGRRRAGLPNA